MDKILQQESNQETLEEAVSEYTDTPSLENIKLAFRNGAEWQAKKMYSREEVNEIISEAWLSCEDNEGETFIEARKRILEQFKKK